MRMNLHLYLAFFNLHLIIKNNLNLCYNEFLKIKFHDNKWILMNFQQIINFDGFN